MQRLMLMLTMDTMDMGDTALELPIIHMAMVIAMLHQLSTAILHMDMVMVLVTVMDMHMLLDMDMDMDYMETMDIMGREKLTLQLKLMPTMLITDMFPMYTHIPMATAMFLLQHLLTDMAMDYLMDMVMGLVMVMGMVMD